MCPMVSHFSTDLCPIWFRSPSSKTSSGILSTTEDREASGRLDEEGDASPAWPQPLSSREAISIAVNICFFKRIPPIVSTLLCVLYHILSLKRKNMEAASAESMTGWNTLGRSSAGMWSRWAVVRSLSHRLISHKAALLLLFPYAGVTVGFEIDRGAIIDYQYE